ncbi:titin [Cronobacter sakazakii 696]|nr:titin [Cronobacter sakazakii 696]
MVAHLITIERREIGNFGRRDHHATGVFTGVTRYAFELARHVDEGFDLFIGIVNFLQLRFGFKRFGKRHAWIGWHQFRDTIDKPVRMPEHAAYVADHRFRRHGAEGNNLGNRVATVHVGHVLNHLVAFFHAEVDVEVGHGDTFRVKETFEQQVEFQRIEIGDFQRIRHQRPRARTTAWPYRNTIILRPLDKLHDDQEVTREAHLVNHLEFNIQALIIFRTFLRADFRIGKQELKTLFQTLFRFHDQEIFGGHVAGREFRQEIFAKANRHVTATGDLHAVFQRLREIGEQLAHLLFGTQILLRRIVARPFRIIERKAIVDGDADFMRVKIARLNKAHVIRGDDRYAFFFRQRDGGMQIALFIRTAGTHQLQIVAVREMLLIKRQRLLGHNVITTK